MTADLKQKGWNWITGFYERPPVRSACLILQDRHKVDVTFLLFLCWLDARGVKPLDHYLTLNEDVLKLRKRVRRTRALRRFLATFKTTKKAAKALLENEILQEKEMFLTLCDYETQKVKGEAVLAKQYIAYKGALTTSAGRMILKQMNA